MRNLDIVTPKIKNPVSMKSKIDTKKLSRAIYNPDDHDFDSFLNDIGSDE